MTAPGLFGAGLSIIGDPKGFLRYRTAMYAMASFGFAR
jgi:hypothetical protein